MITTSLKQSIFNELLDKDLSEVDKVIIGSLLYQYIKTNIQNNNAEMSNVDTLIANNITMYMSNLSSYKTQYVSYHTLENYINNLGDIHFISLPESIIYNICSIYYDKIKIVPFNSKSFSIQMYNLAIIGNRYIRYLRHVHFDIMAYIFEYYKRNNGIKASDFHIYSADGNPDYPGKIIEFYIIGIDNNRIISDILSNKIGFDSSHVYSATLENNRIKLITQ